MSEEKSYDGRDKIRGATPHRTESRCLSLRTLIFKEMREDIADLL